MFGGQGGFLVTWHHDIGVNCVFGRLVSFGAGGVASGDRPDFGRDPGWQLVGNRRGHGVFTHEQAILRRLADSAIRHSRALNRFRRGSSEQYIPLENPFGSRNPSLAWNPANWAESSGWRPLDLAPAHLQGSAGFAPRTALCRLARRSASQPGPSPPRLTSTPGTISTSDGVVVAHPWHDDGDVESVRQSNRDEFRDGATGRRG